LPHKALLAFSGSARPDSSNAWLLAQLAQLSDDRKVSISDLPARLPLFRAAADRAPWPEPVRAWRAAVAAADGLIIATPEYLKNMPALVKNALEWLSSSGELAGKAVLPITLTPHPPRGERAMASLLWTLRALEANVLTQFPVYLSDLERDESGFVLSEDLAEMLREALGLFG
jgi:NAD(P)H-dependent FMN reductase